jgi:hypothetical protein
MTDTCGNCGKRTADVRRGLCRLCRALARIP